MNNTRMAVLCGVAILAAGCSTLQKSDSAALQGTWQGREIGGGTEGACSMVFSGNTVEYRGADTNEWIRGTFTLREDTNPKQLICLATACSYEPAVGQTVYSIYRIEAGTLKVTGNEPGNPDVPAGFEAPGARRFEFRRN